MTIDRRAMILAATALLAPHAALASDNVHRAVLVTRSGQRHTFTVELASTPQEHAAGLMFRFELGLRRGKLFDFGTEEREVSMWMKNTFIALDMLFIRTDGTIRRIAENTEPQTLTAIPSQGSVRAVLAVEGGSASSLGMAAGDKVEHPIFRV